MYPAYRYHKKQKKWHPWRWIFVVIIIITALCWVYMLDWSGVIDIRYVDDNGSAATDPNN